MAWGMRERRGWALAVLLGGLFLLSGPGTASATDVFRNEQGEPSLAVAGGLLDSLYGLGNLTRMDDAVDQKWGNDGLAHVLVLAKHAGYSQTFGYITGDSGGEFVPLVTVTGDGLLSLGEITFTIVESGAGFRWGMDPNGAGVAPDIWSVRESENADHQDHVVTWMITGNQGRAGNRLGAFVIGFEDLYGLGDRDYNDLVVLVWGVTDGPLVPGPASLLLVGAAVLGGGCWRRFRRA